ncbi:MAG: hypothetical protein MJ252_08790 [archaeon]|nr:hypothetical protein [archaeon]
METLNAFDIMHFSQNFTPEEEQIMQRLRKLPNINTANQAELNYSRELFDELSMNPQLFKLFSKVVITSQKTEIKFFAAECLVRILMNYSLQLDLSQIKFLYSNLMNALVSLI